MNDQLQIHTAQLLNTKSQQKCNKGIIEAELGYMGRRSGRSNALIL